MSELAALLGTIAILLTFVASYRLFDFATAGTPSFGILVALGVTVSFMILFEYILILFGIAAVLSPFGLIYYRWGRFPVLSPFIQTLVGKAKQLVGIEVAECDDCGAINEADNVYCKKCGRKLPGSEA